jgi:hypothetical protein
MLKTAGLMVTVLMISTSAFAASQCPEKIQVQVTGVRTASPLDTKRVNAMVKQGQNQTPANYFKTVLVAAQKVKTIRDELRFVKDEYQSCQYKGKETELEINHSYSGITASLKAIKAKYTSTEYSAWGNRVRVSKKLQSINPDTIVSLPQPIKLFVDVEVQWSDGSASYSDGTEIEIGSADSFELKTVK